ncbi:MAG: helix-hairpin-helix domain-containing protein [Bacteroidia bacterium]
MTTEKIANQLKLTAQLMELHDQNPFKIKSIANAAYKLNKTDIVTEGLSIDELEKIEGIGKGIAAKINELQTSGNLKELTELLEITPSGVIEMLTIKGIGVKKINSLWRELQIESVGELLYACNENRLVTLKGFGAKTQEQIKQQIKFHESNRGKFHYATVEKFAIDLVNTLKIKYKTTFVSLTGDIRRKAEIIDKIGILIATAAEINENELENKWGIALEIIKCGETEFHAKLLETTGTNAHLLEIGKVQQPVQSILQDIISQIPALPSEEEIYKHYQLQYIEPELREGINEVVLASKHVIPELLKLSDLRGILHNHTTYSDGVNTLKEMAAYCKSLGYEYFGVCDHSQSAFYANGLKVERVIQQHLEIDELNAQLFPFKIFKGIESDILNDGSLDYPVDILKTFDFIVASVHSNLKMTVDKANARLIKAIENPYTTILGHPTGRLLLARAGYPIDHKKIIDACAQNGVIIELNAHPYRLDIDWRWIHYCVEKGVKISINPDAHEKQGFHDMEYGIHVARKGMLTKSMCFNTLNFKEIENYFCQRRGMA